MTHPLKSGIIPAPIMPFTENAAVDWPTMERYVGQMASGGISALAMNMAAAEATALDHAEQIEALTRTKAVLASAVPMVSGLIAGHTAGAVDHARRLVDAGAEGLVVFPPLPTFMSKPLPVSVVTDYHAAVVDAVDVPIIAFQTANAGYPVGTIRALAELDRVVAIKDAAFDIDRTWEILEEARETDGRVAVLTGNDTFVLEALLMGCEGALIGLAGAFTAEIVKMQRFAAAGQATEAYTIWNEIGPIARVCWSNPLRDYRPRMKYVLMKQGIIPTDVTRAPQTRISDNDRRKIDALFDRHGLSEAKYLPQG
ncbi:dihydrodipicolinate synthase family protein [Roseicitreum antarcticum]|uniref:4-hydroxy-tetrahydrodipicolinate synthase n=1 Tax=Roseicitreum antarcticum TaxID=564137 RepID=A0A1H2YJZ1_9RHOB|nr:dihydrodipicolinate synthase family protein [Roseicitreum antarcticum]SDX05476.1 4-hydroxy-tetrahydrodipicolinate synthase [Roseicitreum antarcticum]